MAYTLMLLCYGTRVIMLKCMCRYGAAYGSLCHDKYAVMARCLHEDVAALARNLAVLADLAELECALLGVPATILLSEELLQCAVYLRCYCALGTIVPHAL